MALEKLGTVRSGRTGTRYTVYWNPSTGEVRVEGKGSIGSAKSAGEAMRKAEASVYDK